jgi:hypothetical protein
VNIYFRQTKAVKLEVANICDMQLQSAESFTSLQLCGYRLVGPMYCTQKYNSSMEKNKHVGEGWAKAGMWALSSLTFSKQPTDLIWLDMIFSLASATY